MSDYFNYMGGSPSFPAMNGYGGGMPATPYADMLNQPSSMFNAGTPSIGMVAPPTSLGFSAPSLPGLGSIDAAPKPGLFDNFFSSHDKQGWGGMALSAAGGLMNGYLGFKQLGVAQDTLAQNKRQFDLNFGAQQKTVNARLEDQQRARVASNPGAYASTADYMKKYGI